MEAFVGTRVVRGPDWTWKEQDGGEGHLGTVAEVQIPDQLADGEKKGSDADGERAPCVVTVQWDCGGRCRYRCGLGGKYDLRGYDSGPAGVVHVGEVCSSCGQDPLTGILWKCARCLEYTICTECYMTGKHFLNHEFDRFITPRERFRVPARGSCKRREVRGMFKFAEVVPWCDWEAQEGTESAESGEVVRLCGKDDDNSRGFVEVQWKENDLKTIHMVGHKGKVELKCVDPSSGGYYYPDHLPLLGASQPQSDPAAVSTGDLVRVELEADVFQAVQERRCGWNDLMLNVIGKVGKVVAIISSGDLKVRYMSENLLCTFCPESVVKVMDQPRYKEGDVVRITSDLEKLRSHQKSHGGPADTAILMMGEVGTVHSVYGNGDVTVKVKTRSWNFNPQCVTLASESKGETAVVDNTFTEWAKKDADENIKMGLRTIMKKRQPETIFMAISLGEIDILREFLTENPGMVDYCSEGGRTALHFTAMSGLVESMKVLLEFNANVEHQDDTSSRPLHTSAYYGSAETTQLLVDAGADVNARTLDGCTPAIFAASHGKSRILKVLLRSPNIDVSIQDESGSTALHAAVMCQKMSSVLPLLDAGADPCMLNFSLMTPLHFAARLGCVPVMEAFLGRDPGYVTSKDGYSQTILHAAALQDHLDIMALAMQHRQCEVNAKCDYDQTPLHLAIARGNTRSIEKLVEYGANVNVADQEGCTPLHYITTRDSMEPPNEDSPMIFKLYKALFGKVVDENPSFGMYGIVAVTVLLLKKGADIHATPKSGGRSPYQILPFLGTLMTVLVDYEDIIEEGGHPDGSPLLRLTDKQGGHSGKKFRPPVYQDSGGGSGSADSSSDYYSQSSRPVMMIRTVPGYGEDYSGAASSSSFSGKKNKKKWNQSGGGGGGGAGGGGYGGSGGGRYYQEYSPAYAAYDDFTLSESVTHRDPSGKKNKAEKKPQSSSDSTATISPSSAYAASWSSPASTISDKQTSSAATATSSGSPRGGSMSSSAHRGGTSGTFPAGNEENRTSPPAQPRHEANTSTSSTSSSSSSNTTSGDELCCMCDNVMDVKFSPCGHAAMCSQCASRIKRCPLCKISVSGVYNKNCVNCRRRESTVLQNCGHGLCNNCKNSPVCAGCNEPNE